MATSAILVVDDERLIRWSLKTHLERAGYQVVQAENARDGLLRFDDTVRLVVLDLKLPDGAGIEVLRQIRSMRPDCPVIMMSAHWSPETMREAVDGGAINVLQKPFRLDDVAAAVAIALA